MREICEVCRARRAGERRIVVVVIEDAPSECKKPAKTRVLLGDVRGTRVVKTGKLRNPTCLQPRQEVCDISQRVPQRVARSTRRGVEDQQPVTGGGTLGAPKVDPVLQSL